MAVPESTRSEEYLYSIFSRRSRDSVESYEIYRWPREGGRVEGSLFSFDAVCYPRNMAFAAIGSKIYMIGGEYSTDIVEVETKNLYTNDASQILKTHSNVLRRGCPNRRNAFAINGKIYTFPKRLVQYQPLSTSRFEVFDPDTGASTLLDEPPLVMMDTFCYESYLPFKTKLLLAVKTRYGLWMYAFDTANPHRGWRDITCDYAKRPLKMPLHKNYKDASYKNYEDALIAFQRMAPVGAPVPPFPVVPPFPSSGSRCSHLPVVAPFPFEETLGALPSATAWGCHDGSRFFGNKSFSHPIIAEFQDDPLQLEKCTPVRGIPSRLRGKPSFSHGGDVFFVRPLDICSDYHCARCYGARCYADGYADGYADADGSGFGYGDGCGDGHGDGEDDCEDDCDGEEDCDGEGAQCKDQIWEFTRCPLFYRRVDEFYVASHRRRRGLVVLPGINDLLFPFVISVPI